MSTNQLALFQEDAIPMAINKVLPNALKTAESIGTCQVLVPQLDIVQTRITTFYNSPTTISSAKDIQNYLRQCFNPYKINVREEFIAVFLNRRNRVIGWAQMSTGSTTGTVVDKKHIIYLALQMNATALIIAHNHPSGNVKPSPQDRTLTDAIKKGCELFDINLMDHVILSDEGYYSFAEDGLI